VWFIQMRLPKKYLTQSWEVEDSTYKILLKSEFFNTLKMRVPKKYPFIIDNR
jgi:hypothetical protein